jgi:hypothetical protein
LLGQLEGGEGGVVAADRDQRADVEPEQGGDGLIEQLGVVRRVGAGDADERTAAKVDPADFLVVRRVT